MRYAITITTINKPTVIESYIKNIQNYSHKNVAIIIVGDKKTPSGVEDYCASVARESSITVKYLDVDLTIRISS